MKLNIATSKFIIANYAIQKLILLDFQIELQTELSFILKTQTLELIIYIHMQKFSLYPKRVANKTSFLYPFLGFFTYGDDEKASLSSELPDETWQTGEWQGAVLMNAARSSLVFTSLQTRSRIERKSLTTMKILNG